MSSKPFKPLTDASLVGVDEVSSDRAFIARYFGSSVPLGTTTAVHAAVTDTGSAQTITTGITDPAHARNVTATAGGTAGDIGAISVVITGTNIADEVITETLPAFTVDTAGTKVGVKAFKTITSILLPAHDGTGATTAIGLGDALGLSHRLSHDTVIATFLDDAREGTAPTVTTTSLNVEQNKATLDSALDGNDVDIYYMVRGGQ